MSVKTASKLMSRVMRAAIKETISPANQGITKLGDRQSLSETVKVSHQFGKGLHQQANAYTGLVDEFGIPDNTVDNWRLQFSRRDGGLKAANSSGDQRKRQG